MQLYVLRIVSLVVVALIYMLFDVFNKRNVPSFFAYATVVYGVILTISYFNVATILTSGAIALVVLGAGYLVYKVGQLGFADVIEFVALSLIFPLQKGSILIYYSAQYSFPFLVSVAVNTGIVAIILAPIFYIPEARKRLGVPLSSLITRRDLLKSLLLSTIYLVFILFVFLYTPISYIGVLILILILVSSSMLILFSTPMAESLVQYLSVDKFEEGDMIDLNLMGAKKVSKMRKRIKDFGGLVTNSLISKMKKAKIKEKFPVYREGIPFALFIFIGTMITILFGNVLLLLFVIR